MLKTLFTSETFKNMAVVVGLLTTLGGAVSFGVTKVSSYDSYETRIARLEAHDDTLNLLTQSAHDAQFDRSSLHTDLTTTIRRVDDLTKDVTQSRLDIVRLNTILEHRR